MWKLFFEENALGTATICFQFALIQRVISRSLLVNVVYMSVKAAATSKGMLF